MDEGPVKAEWLPGTTQEGTGEEKLAAFKKQVMSFYMSGDNSVGGETRLGS